MKRFALLGVILLLVSTTAIVAAASQTATDRFSGTATTGVGMPMPIDINPADLDFSRYPAIGLGYTYRASGKAQGELPGDFVYEEHGYLYFYNPMDPTTFAGSAFVSGVFTLNPHRPGPMVTIADTNPAAYSSGIGLQSTSAKGTLGYISRVINGQGGMQPGRDDLYGYFTFTNQYGTYTGYATPDFRSFEIEIQFDR